MIAGWIALPLPWQCSHTSVARRDSRGDHAREIVADDGVVGVLDDIREPERQFVGCFPVRDITSEAACVKELIVPPQHVRIDQDVTD